MATPIPPSTYVNGTSSSNPPPEQREALLQGRDPTLYAPYTQRNPSAMPPLPVAANGLEDRLRGRVRNLQELQMDALLREVSGRQFPSPSYLLPPANSADRGGQKLTPARENLSTQTTKRKTTDSTPRGFTFHGPLFEGRGKRQTASAPQPPIAAREMEKGLQERVHIQREPIVEAQMGAIREKHLPIPANVQDRGMPNLAPVVPRQPLQRAKRTKTDSIPKDLKFHLVSFDTQGKSVASSIATDVVVRILPPESNNAPPSGLKLDEISSDKQGKGITSPIAANVRVRPLPPESNDSTPSGLKLDEISSDKQDKKVTPPIEDTVPVHPLSQELLNSGIAYLKEQDFPRAARAFNQSYSLDKGILGSLFDAFNKLFNENPNFPLFTHEVLLQGPSLLLLRAMFYITKHKYAKAANDLEKICDKDPDHDLARVLLTFCNQLFEEKANAQNPAARADLTRKVDSADDTDSATLS